MVELLQPLLVRSFLLVPALLLALALGQPIGQLLKLHRLRHAIGQRIVRLGTKLNRPQRSTATRLYRGMVTLGMLLVPALLVGLLLTHRFTATFETITLALLVPVFGIAVSPYRFLRLWRDAKRNRLTLQSDDPAYLFLDQAGKLRDAILRLGECFSIALVGGGLWFALAAWPGLLLYWMLAATAAYYAPGNPIYRAFGWAAAGLFALANALPRLLACTLLWLAALATPRTRPFTALKRAGLPFYGWFAALVDVSIGGPLPRPGGIVTLPWLGEGSPQPTVRDLGRTLQLVAIATMLFFMLLGSSIYGLSFVK